MAAKVDIEHFDKHPKLSLNQAEPKGWSVKNQKVHYDHYGLCLFLE